MKIARRFTATGMDAYQGIVFEPRRLIDDEELAFAPSLTVPAGWSLTAVEALLGVTCTADVPAATLPVNDPRTPLWLCPKKADTAMLATYPIDERAGPERDARQVFDRLAGFWAYTGWQAGFFDTEADARAYYDELRHMLARQMAAPAESIWRETGLGWAYGLTGSTIKAFRVDPGTGQIVSVTDAMAGPVAQRQPARVMNINAPGSLNFIRSRVIEEQKLAALVTGARVLGRHAEAILAASATGFEADNLNRLNPAHNQPLALALYKARQAGLPDNVLLDLLAKARQGQLAVELPTYDLDGDNAAYRELGIEATQRHLTLTTTDIGAHDNWSALISTIWQSAEPVLEFAETRDEWQSIAGLDATLAPQATINLARFRGPDKRLDLDGFTHAVRLMTLTLELIGLSRATDTEGAAETAYRQRPLALSLGNLSAYLTASGLVHDSAEARATGAAMAALLTGVAFATSAEMAAEMGAFPDYMTNGARMLRVLANQRTAGYGKSDGYEGLTRLPLALAAEECRDTDLTAAVRMAWDMAVEQGRRHGYRNATVTDLSPVDGMTGGVLDLDSDLHRPEVNVVKSKRLPDGGVLKHLSAVVPEALSVLGYSEAEMADIRDHALGRATLKGAPFINFETLRDRGFNDAVLTRVEAALPEASDLRFIFTKWTLGEEFCLQKLGIPADKLNDYVFDLLGWLGFLPPEVDAASRFACGTGTLCDAPHLHDAHRALFLAPGLEGEVRMMAALQPFISGTVGGTLHLPVMANISQVDELVRLAAALGLKSIAIYRDGARLTQQLALELPEVVEAPVPVSAATAPVRHGREALPDRRRGYTLRTVIEGQEIYLRTAEYADGRLGEVTLELPQADTALSGPLQQMMSALTLALQYGVPLVEFTATLNLTRHGGKPGIILNALMAELAASYAAATPVQQDNAPVARNSWQMAPHEASLVAPQA